MTATTALRERITGITSRQYGLISRAQAYRVGLTKAQVLRQVASGRWREVRPSVFLLSGAPRTRRMEIMAACLRFKGAASHHTAAELNDLDMPRSREIHISTAGCFEDVEGVKLHQRVSFAINDRYSCDGIPCTTVPRTIRDSCAMLSVDQAETLVEDALNRKRTALDLLRACHERTRGRGNSGTTTLEAVFVRHARAEATTQSSLETEFHQLVRRNHLPEPRRQLPQTAHGICLRVDFIWQHAGVVVEVDGERWHARRKAWAEDLRRRTALQASGLRVLAFTAHSIREDEERVVAQIRETLRVATQLQIAI